MYRKVTLLILVVLLVSFVAAAPASAEWIQNPTSGEYWYCDYYSDGYYWCYVPSTGNWLRAVPGWQYLPPGG